MESLGSSNYGMKNSARYPTTSKVNWPAKERRCLSLRPQIGSGRTPPFGATGQLHQTELARDGHSCTMGLGPAIDRSPQREENTPKNPRACRLALGHCHRRDFLRLGCRLPQDKLTGLGLAGAKANFLRRLQPLS